MMGRSVSHSNTVSTTVAETVTVAMRASRESSGGAFRRHEPTIFDHLHGQVASWHMATEDGDHLCVRGRGVMSAPRVVDGSQSRAELRGYSSNAVPTREGLQFVACGRSPDSPGREQLVHRHHAGLVR